MVESGVYVGTITHRRHSPRPHQFRYSLFMSLLDIERIDELMQVSALTSINRWNLASFHDCDHIGDQSVPLRERVRTSAAAAGRTLPDGPVFLLTHLRYAGYVFNPISIYYCFDNGGDLRQVLADVRNTYGGRRSYWLDPADSVRHRFRSVTAKALFVSPFMGMDLEYEFLLTVPGETLVVHMNLRQSGTRDLVFDATLDLERRPWTAAMLRKTLVGYPLMTARVIGGIHLEALRLRLKGVPAVPTPPGLQ